MTRFLHVIICFLTGGALADVISLEARVGGDVQIRCSHGFAHKNVKYFCNKTCLNRDVLIKSDRMRNPNRKGRYTLLDEGSGVFTVTISGLKKSDSGTYWCGVQRMVKDTYLQVILTVLEAPATTSYTQYPTASHPGNSQSDASVKSTESRTESETSSTITGDFFTTTDTTNPETPENRQLVYIGSGLACLVLISAICLLILIKQTKKRKSEKHKAGKAQIDCNNKHSKPEKDLQIPMKTNQQKTPESFSANQSTPPIKNPHPDPSSSIYSNITPHSEVNFARQSEDIHYSSVIFIRESDAHNSHLDSSPGETAGPSVSLYSTVIPADSSLSAKNTTAVIYSTIGKES
ncbi:CMRF35-like molecule 3 [Astyanax mexicanus]|uniref:CMRF35-like molecule 3 n=1 Tax=Astyanax mexicanus TaxID=7994 RepID=UPI0020CB0E6A|nr:CMRF35-like molecule 3 [Astyanax mexicanus]